MDKHIFVSHVENTYVHKYKTGRERTKRGKDLAGKNRRGKDVAGKKTRRKDWR